MGNFLIILSASIAIFLYFYFQKQAVTRRKLYKNPFKKINKFIDGERGRITGKVVLTKNSLRAPLSGRLCSYYHVIVFKKSGKSTYEIINEEKSGKLLIYDGSGYALIVTANANNYILPDANYTSGFLNNASEKLELYLNKHNTTSKNIIGLNKQLEYSEGILEKNEIVSVSGTGIWEDAAQHELKIPSEKILVFRSDPNNPLTITDDPELTKVDVNGH